MTHWQGEAEGVHVPNGAMIAPTLAMMRRTSGGALPLYWIVWRANSLCRNTKYVRWSMSLMLGKETHPFQYGWVPSAANMPMPIPRNDRPVCWTLKPCTSSKMMGNAWKARYRMPNTSADLAIASVVCPSGYNLCTYHRSKASAMRSYVISSGRRSSVQGKTTALMPTH